MCVCVCVVAYALSLFTKGDCLYCWGMLHCSIKPTTPVARTRWETCSLQFWFWFLRNACYNGRLQCLKKTFHESSKGKKKERESVGDVRYYYWVSCHCTSPPHPKHTFFFLLFHPSFLLVRSFIFFFFFASFPFVVLNKGHGRWGRAPSSDQVQVSLSVASDNSSSLLVLLDYSSLLELLAYVSNDATRHLAEVLSSHALAVSAAINLSKLPNTNALLEVNTSGYTGSTDEIPVRVIRGQLLVGTSLDQVHVSTRLQLKKEKKRPETRQLS